MTEQHADFEIFEAEVRDSYQNLNTFLRAYTAYDAKLVSALKARTKAVFRRDDTGRAYWSIFSESGTAATFRKLINEAATRAGHGSTPCAPTMSPAQLAAWYDRGHNEGGEGYNPYRRG